MCQNTWHIQVINHPLQPSNIVHMVSNYYEFIISTNPPPAFNRRKIAPKTDCRYFTIFEAKPPNSTNLIIFKESTPQIF